MTVLLLIATAQLASSFCRTLSVNSVVKSSALKAALVTAASDALFYGVTAGVTSQVINGNWQAVVAAVIGGAVGNYVAVKVLNR
jgi:hypothetical protein